MPSMATRRASRSGLRGAADSGRESPGRCLPGSPRHSPRHVVRRAPPGRAARGTSTGPRAWRDRARHPGARKRPTTAAGSRCSQTSSGEPPAARRRLSSASHAVEVTTLPAERGHQDHGYADAQVLLSDGRDCLVPGIPGGSREAVVVQVVDPDHVGHDGHQRPGHRVLIDESCTQPARQGAAHGALTRAGPARQEDAREVLEPRPCPRCCQLREWTSARSPSGSDG